jgi:hypothetical protein
MHRSATITLVDAARITRDEAGKVHVKETDELTAKEGAVRARAGRLGARGARHGGASGLGSADDAGPRWPAYRAAAER